MNNYNYTPTEIFLFRQIDLLPTHKCFDLSYCNAFTQIEFSSFPSK